MCHSNNNHNYNDNNVAMIVVDLTLQTVLPVQCFCHTSVNSQEDKRVGFTKIVGTDHRKKESHQVLKTSCYHQPTNKRKQEEEGEGCLAVGRSVAFVWWLSEDVVEPVTDRSSSKRRDAC